ncbi:MAG: 23S rRNA (pseudouridine(1915)-N(3))-methyltransferase RlmH [Burkholderiales bacterium]|nr:23S rRNA (pseudouridine(1915)-N(3))-methyltransferase RlmH [Burkholderiales bacterium]
MKLRIVALGHRMPAWVSAGYDDYARRMPREFAIELVELKPAARSGGKTMAQALAAEAVRIRSACSGCRMLALDERGAAWTTRALAKRIGQWHAEGADIAFVIGSADGLDPSIKREALATIALSAMTLPHGLARVLLAEQLYRAVTVNSGHPYHRD